MKELTKSIEKKLGYELPQNRKNTISKLDDIPAELLADAKSLGTPLLAEQFLRHFLTGDCEQYLKVFIQDKVFQNSIQVIKKV